jgi:lipoprotein-releasing system ATP-binding protein
MRAQSTAEGMSAANPAPGAPAPAVIRAEGLRKTYRSGGAELTVLAGIELEVTRGEMIAVVGPSGAGKSTLLHLLAALDTPTSGTVYFEAEPLAAFSEDRLAEFRNRLVGFVWQRHHLLPDFTAEENVAMPLLLRAVPRDEASAEAARWLEEVGLGSRTGARAAELSGGEQQRAAIARALVHRPAVLLADEPTGDLDEQNAESVFELMRRLHQAHRLTSILATHNLALARRCDRVLRLEHGILAPEPGAAVRPKPGESPREAHAHGDLG